MRRSLIALVLALVVAGGTAGATLAQGGSSPVNEPGVDGAHFHHVDTPSGCHAVGTVAFERTDHGLHQGALASGAGQGVEHFGC